MVTVIPLLIGAIGTFPKFDKKTGSLGNKQTSGDHPDYNFMKIGQNTE